MDQLDDIIRSATRDIAPDYFHLPVAEREPALYERAYCYELYHQIRRRWPADTNLVITGEIPKHSHEIIKEQLDTSVVPDFLIHVPGSMGHNHAIIEVKSARATRSGIRKDLATLDQFCAKVGYARAIYLFYGGVDQELVDELAMERPVVSNIDVWLHAEPGIEAGIIMMIRPG
ncbi:hypothetical protein ASE23_12885 [Rhizobium sp. Root73]|uniref:hypothetical protein n=1 Tax=unclassified Rhizobium TaxID=2613769 RepID=UPI000726C6A6|nr:MULTISPECIES: hypothetical protein [unclassified Rhizobium]KQY03688.1 hypothetical protein ASD36_15080 [Rhizobium sp. Root1334]KRC00330.1 hypothetical protein ASE23_12885 [Rhizobium sp. Root73]